MAVLTPYMHIELNENGVPVLSDSRLKVKQIAIDHIGNRWSPEAIQIQYPYLTMGQIHSALAYYWDHQQQLDDEIEREFLWVEEQRAAQTPSPLFERLRALKRE